jgi:hypothetical protein
MSALFRLLPPEGRHHVCLGLTRTWHLRRSSNECPVYLVSSMQTARGQRGSRCRPSSRAGPAWITREQGTASTISEYRSIQGGAFLWGKKARYKHYRQHDLVLKTATWSRQCTDPRTLYPGCAGELPWVGGPGEEGRIKNGFHLKSCFCVSHVPIVRGGKI